LTINHLLRLLRSSLLAIGKLLNLIGKVEEMMECHTEASRILRDEMSGSQSLVIAGYNFFGLSRLHPAGAAVA